MTKNLLHTPEGVRDIYGNELQQKIAVEDQLNKTIKSFGYSSIQTPTFEYFDVFSKEVGTTKSRELYKFFDNENNTLVLRPDFTPSIARCAAKYFMEDQVPLRFTYTGNTFTNTHSLQGKLNEVTQMGAELINDSSVYADAEIISLVVFALKNTGLSKFQISIGEMEYFKGLCEEAGLDEETELELREYISGKNYFAALELLNEKDVAEHYKLIFLKIADVSENLTSLEDAKALVNNVRSNKAIERLQKLYDLLKIYGVEDYVSFDLGILSKYNYYTGIVFRAYTYGVGNAIVKGGRYDTLLNHFGKKAPAIGFAIVVDELLEALQRQKCNTNHIKSLTTITYTDENFEQKINEAMKLRKEGCSVELIPEGTK